MACTISDVSAAAKSIVFTHSSISSGVSPALITSFVASRTASMVQFSLDARDTSVGTIGLSPTADKGKPAADDCLVNMFIAVTSANVIA